MEIFSYFWHLTIMMKKIKDIDFRLKIRNKITKKILKLYVTNLKKSVS